MPSLPNKISLAVLAGVLWVGPATAQPSPGDSGSAPPAGHATFQTLPPPPPPPAPYYPGYPTIQDPNSGYLSAASDVINAQGQFLVNKKQSEMMDEQVKQAKIQTRRAHIDEYMYERQVLPTQEDERERARLEALRRSRNDPPITEIWSGGALNRLLLAIQQQLSSSPNPGPNVPLTPDVLAHINVTSGGTPGSLGLLRDGGRLRWPQALRGDTYGDERKALNELAAQAFQQASAGNVSSDTIDEMVATTRKLERALKANIDELAPEDYIKAKRFLEEMQSTIKTLQDPNIGNYATHKWAARGDNVADLVREMSQSGLHFAPAVDGDQAAYVSLHRSMVAYLNPAAVMRGWDPAAK